MLGRFPSDRRHTSHITNTLLLTSKYTLSKTSRREVTNSCQAYLCPHIKHTDVHLALQPSCSIREYSRPCTEITQHYGTIFRCMTHSYVSVAPFWIETFLSWNLTPPPSKHGISHPGIINVGGCRSVRLFLGLSVHTLTSFYSCMKLCPSKAQSVFPGVSHKTASSFNENWVTGTSDTTGWAACCWPEYWTTAKLAFRLNSAFTASHSLVHMFHSKLKPPHTLSIYKHMFIEHKHTPSYFSIPATCFGSEHPSWGGPLNYV